ncbi:MAG TPA: type II toxin-antitoxin system HicA family toxin [Gammaproteobacteria bacterium]
MDGKEVIKRLRAAGSELVGISGSHRKPGDRKVTVPIHGKRDIPMGTLKSIERHAGVKLKGE